MELPMASQMVVQMDIPVELEMAIKMVVPMDIQMELQMDILMDQTIQNGSQMEIKKSVVFLLIELEEFG